MSPAEQAAHYRKALQDIADLEAAGYTLNDIAIRALRLAKKALDA